MKPETEFNSEIVTVLVHECLARGLRLHITRIESNYTQQGIPDINFCLEGHEAWIESKVDEEPRSALQLSWHKQRYNAGGKVFTLRKISCQTSSSVVHYNLVYADYFGTSCNFPDLIDKIIVEVMK